MKSNFAIALPEILKHEGGFVDHPKDPGGATNKGITIGTLKRLGIDVDGDGDSDLADLKSLRHEHVSRVYKMFYWDAVKADLLPAGLDYTVADFAVNSGPSRAAKHLQRAVGVAQDGDIGPATLAAVAKHDPAALIEAVNASRMHFLRGLRTWATFGKGWSRRVNEVRSTSLAMAINGGAQKVIPNRVTLDADAPRTPRPEAPTVKPNGTVGAVIAAAILTAAAIIAGAWERFLNLFN